MLPHFSTLGIGESVCGEGLKVVIQLDCAALLLDGNSGYIKVIRSVGGLRCICLLSL